MKNNKETSKNTFNYTVPRESVSLNTSLSQKEPQYSGRKNDRKKGLAFLNQYRLRVLFSFTNPLSNKSSKPKSNKPSFSLLIVFFLLTSGFAVLYQPRLKQIYWNNLPKWEFLPQKISEEIVLKNNQKTLPFALRKEKETIAAPHSKFSDFFVKYASHFHYSKKTLAGNTDDFLRTYNIFIDLPFSTSYQKGGKMVLRVPIKDYLDLVEYFFSSEGSITELFSRKRLEQIRGNLTYFNKKTGNPADLDFNQRFILDDLENKDLLSKLSNSVNLVFTPNDTSEKTVLVNVVLKDYLHLLKSFLNPNLKDLKEVRSNLLNFNHIQKKTTDLFPQNEIRFDKLFYKLGFDLFDYKINPIVTQFDKLSYLSFLTERDFSDHLKFWAPSLCAKLPLKKQVINTDLVEFSSWVKSIKRLDTGGFLPKRNAKKKRDLVDPLEWVKGVNKRVVNLFDFILPSDKNDPIDFEKGWLDNFSNLLDFDQRIDVFSNKVGNLDKITPIFQKRDKVYFRDWVEKVDDSVFFSLMNLSNPGYEFKKTSSESNLEITSSVFENKEGVRSNKVGILLKPTYLPGTPRYIKGLKLGKLFVKLKPKSISVPLHDFLYLLYDYLNLDSKQRIKGKALHRKNKQLKNLLSQKHLNNVRSNILSFNQNPASFLNQKTVKKDGDRRCEEIVSNFYQSAPVFSETRKTKEIKLGSDDNYSPIQLFTMVDFGSVETLDNFKAGITSKSDLNTLQSGLNTLPKKFVDFYKNFYKKKKLKSIFNKDHDSRDFYLLNEKAASHHQNSQKSGLSRESLDYGLWDWTISESPYTLFDLNTVLEKDILGSEQKTRPHHHNSQLVKRDPEDGYNLFIPYQGKSIGVKKRKEKDKDCFLSKKPLLFQNALFTAQEGSLVSVPEFQKQVREKGIDLTKTLSFDKWVYKFGLFPSEWSGDRFEWENDCLEWPLFKSLDFDLPPHIPLYKPVKISKMLVDEKGVRVDEFIRSDIHFPFPQTKDPFSSKKVKRAYKVLKNHIKPRARYQRRVRRIEEVELGLLDLKDLFKSVFFKNRLSKRTNTWIIGLFNIDYWKSFPLLPEKKYDRVRLFTSSPGGNHSWEKEWEKELVERFNTWKSVSPHWAQLQRSGFFDWLVSHKLNFSSLIHPVKDDLETSDLKPCQAYNINDTFCFFHDYDILAYHSALSRIEKDKKMGLPVWGFKDWSQKSKTTQETKDKPLTRLVRSKPRKTTLTKDLITALPLLFNLDEIPLYLEGFEFNNSNQKIKTKISRLSSRRVFFALTGIWVSPIKMKADKYSIKTDQYINDFISQYINDLVKKGQPPRSLRPSTQSRSNEKQDFVYKPSLKQTQINSNRQEVRELKSLLAFIHKKKKNNQKDQMKFPKKGGVKNEIFIKRNFPIFCDQFKKLVSRVRRGEFESFPVKLLNADQVTFLKLEAKRLQTRQRDQRDFNRVEVNRVQKQRESDKKILKKLLYPLSTDGYKDQTFTLNKKNLLKKYKHDKKRGSESLTQFSNDNQFNTTLSTRTRYFFTNTITNPSLRLFLPLRTTGLNIAKSFSEKIATPLLFLTSYNIYPTHDLESFFQDDLKDTFNDYTLVLYYQNFKKVKIHYVVILLASIWLTKTVLIISLLSYLHLDKIGQSSFIRFWKEVLNFFLRNKKIKNILKGENEPSFSIKEKHTVTFLDIIGIKKHLPQLFIIFFGFRKIKKDPVFFLKKLSHQLSFFKTKKIVGTILPRGYIFTGHPGTGKMFLVKALACESNVNLIVQRGSALIDNISLYDTSLNTKRVTKLFQRAKAIAPCLVFIDEIDLVGLRRKNVEALSPFRRAKINPISLVADPKILIKKGKNLKITKDWKLVDSPYYVQDFPEKSPFEELPDDPESKPVKLKYGKAAVSKYLIYTNDRERYGQVRVLNPKEKGFSPDLTIQINVLLQLLVEMDRLSHHQGVVFIGATNRFRFLDYALRRPGRFSGVVRLLLPKKSRRIEILKVLINPSGLVPKKPELVENSNQKDLDVIPFFINTILKLSRLWLKRRLVDKYRKALNKHLSNLVNESFKRFNEEKELRERRERTPSSLIKKPEPLDLIIKQYRTFLKQFRLELKSISLTILGKICDYLTDLTHNDKDDKLYLSLNVLIELDIMNLDFPLVEPKMRQNKMKEGFLDREWDYLGRLTYNFTPADLTSAIKISSMRMIAQNTQHTLETIETGIFAVTSPGFGKANNKSRFFTLAYYQAGNAVIRSLLPQLEDPILLTLPPLPKITRQQQGIGNFESLISLESRIIGAYAGKAAELVFFSTIGKTKKSWKAKQERSQLNKNSISDSFLSHQKSIEIADLSIASYIAYALIQKFYFYLDITPMWKGSDIPAYVAHIQDRRSSFNITGRLQLDLLEAQNNIKTKPPTISYMGLPQEFWSKISYIVDVVYCLHIHSNHYHFSSDTMQTNNQWERFYLKDLSQIEARNPELTDPDSYHQENNTLKDLFQFFKLFRTNKPLTNKRNNTINFTWNDLCDVNKDYIYHGLTLTSFNHAFDLLDENRELLDYLAESLLHLEILRPWEILEVVSRFNLLSPDLKNKELIEKKERSDKLEVIKDFNEKEKINKIIKRKWGNHSILTSSDFFTFTPES